MSWLLYKTADVFFHKTKTLKYNEVDIQFINNL